MTSAPKKMAETKAHSSLSSSFQNSLDIDKKAKTKSVFLDSTLLNAPAQIWKSRISWRITLAVFLTILTVQAGIMNVGLKAYEEEELYTLRQMGRTAIAPLLSQSVTDLLASPVSRDDIDRLLSTTLVSGLAIYSAQFDLIGLHGEPVVLSISDYDSVTQTYRSHNGDSYEVVYRSNELGRPYLIVAKLDSSDVQNNMMSFVQKNILIMLLTSAFVTSVLMLALGRWLLEPILFLRNNLIEASKSPEKPEITDSPYDPSDEIGGAIAIAHKLIKQNADNLTRIKSAAEDKIHKLAYYDTLTGLPNRTLFLQKLAESTRAGSDEKMDRFAVVTIDLDHFKDINDTVGHNVGDAILRNVGKRLRLAMPESAMVSRTGEDEFAVTMPLHKDGNSAREVGERVLNLIRGEPFKIFNEEFQVRASIGVATFPDDGVEPDTVLKNADIALNRAKEEGRDVIKEYSEDFDRVVQQRFQLLRDLREALECDQLTLHYQPQFDLKTGELIGAEALLRWFKPDQSKEGGAYISPIDFIPIAEQSGLIVPIGEWVLERACKDAVEWKEKHGIDIRVAVNVSAAQFAAQSDICGYVQKVLKDTKLNPEKLELEVTESVFMDDIDNTIGVLNQLNGLGVELAIDDFGTGYSSLSYLSQFPIDRLKIDQSFIRNALNDGNNASITRTIVALGHALGLKVIAEGVETIDHENFLKQEGCDEVQGFRYSRPVALEDFVKFAADYSGKLESFGA